MSKNFHLTANSTSEGRFIPQSVHRQPKNLIPFGNILFTFRPFFYSSAMTRFEFFGKKTTRTTKKKPFTISDIL